MRRAKVRGLATYGVDYAEAGMLHARLLRSPVPAGRITRLDVSGAWSMPGVHLVVTAADAPSHRNGLVLLDTPFFATDTLLYEGEPDRHGRGRHRPPGRSRSRGHRPRH